MRVAVGSDHSGFPMKAFVLEQLEKLGHEATDVGSYDPAPVDFPDIAGKLCGLITSGKVDRGILVCGTGVGASIAANKVPGIRAALLHDVHCAHQAVEHDDVNVMCIGAQIIGPWLAADLLRAFLDARFQDTEQYRRRVAKLADMDRSRSNG